MLHRLSLLTLMIVALVAASTLSSKSPAHTHNSTHSPKVKALLEERRDVLAKRVEFFNAQFQNAKISRVPVMEAGDDLFSANLDLAETRDARIEQLKARLENLKEIEATYGALKQRAMADDSNVLLATSRRLLSEIELERALSSD